MADIHGSCEDRFGAVREALERNLRSEELGARVAVDLDGETVVDIWGGFRDQERTTPWTEDTIVNVWSTTKTITSLAALMLVDRGELDVYAPVAEYWPEFAANGKGDIEVRHLMAHTSGVSGWDPPFVGDDMYDWESSVAKLAAQAPWWEPGTASGYHALNQGHLVGEVIRRVSGKTLKQFVAEEIAGPLGRRLPDRRPRGGPGPHLRRHPAAAAAVRPRGAGPGEPCRADVHRPGRGRSCGQHRGLARRGHGRHQRARQREIGRADHAGHVARREGRRHPPAVPGDDRTGLRRAGRRRGPGPRHPAALRDRVRAPQAGDHPLHPGRQICFWGGWGGSLIVMDLDRRLTIGYTMNRMAPGIIGSDRAESYLRAVYGALA